MKKPDMLKQHKEDVAVLLKCLVEMRSARKAILNNGLMNKWAYTLQNEFIAPVLHDELYHVYRELSTMAKANRFSAEELGIVHSILKICGQYDDLEKLHYPRE